MLANPTARAEAEHGDQRQGEQQGRDRQDHVDEPHDRVVDPAADEPADEADEGSDDEADDHGEQRRLHRQRSAVDDPGVEVPAQLVRPEQVRPRR
jgi:hypothetical protein